MKLSVAAAYRPCPEWVTELLEIELKLKNEFCVKDLVINEFSTLKFISKKVDVQGTDGLRYNTGPMIRKITEGLATFHRFSKHV